MVDLAHTKQSLNLFCTIQNQMKLGIQHRIPECLQLFPNGDPLDIITERSNLRHCIFMGIRLNKAFLRNC